MPQPEHWDSKAWQTSNSNGQSPTPSSDPDPGPPYKPFSKMWLRPHFVAASGEFMGTFLFLFFGYAGHMMVVDENNSAVPGSMDTMYIGFAYGFSLLVTVWAFYRISGGLFNPAVTFGMVISNQLAWLRGLILFPAQIVACICAGFIVKVMFPGDVADLNTKLAPHMSIVRGVFAEMVFTSLLVFVVLMLAAEKSKDTFLAPVGIGLALFVAEIPGVYFTGGSLNPARSFGCAVAGYSFPGYHWIYWIGPGAGAILAAAYYRFVKLLHYEEANPGQDHAGDEEAPMTATRSSASRSEV